MKLYEYAVIFHPNATKEDRDAGKAARSILVVPVTQVLAKTEQEASMLAARAIPAEYADRLDRVEIAIRPF